MRIKSTAIALTLGLSAFGFATPSSALFIIDDFNTSTLYTVEDTTVNATPVTVAAAPTAGNIVWGVLGGGTASRSISADLTAGDKIGTQICNMCQTGESFADAGLTPSVGLSIWSYQGASVDVSGETNVMLDWVSDLAGATITFSFTDFLANTASVTSGILPGAFTATTLMLALPGGVDYTQLVAAAVQINGVAALDANIDNFKLVPEPASIGLLGLGLVGLGLAVRRRRSV